MKKIIILILLSTLVSCSSFEVNNDAKKIKGFYSYMADAALFYDCETGKKHPVAFEGDNLKLEKAYLEINENAGEKILVTLLGNYELRDKIEGTGKEEFLVVTKFINIWPNIDCNRNLGTANLVNTFWALRKLNEKSFEFSFGLEKDVHFLITPNNKIKGFSGCNNFFGYSYNSNDTLNFNDLGTALEICKDKMEIEAEFLSTLEKTIKYKIYGEFLYLYGSKGLLAKFESVYFN